MTGLAENPFFVLGATPAASRLELEREAQKLLGMLELGFAAAKTYETPLGPRERTAELVRAAIAALRDPYQRLVAELWARHAPPPRAAGLEPEPEPASPRVSLWPKPEARSPKPL
ncbi:MAG TPA: hypothetical protein VGF94_03705 [Kofleriaceae bacterium]